MILLIYLQQGLDPDPADTRTQTQTTGQPRAPACWDLFISFLWVSLQPLGQHLHSSSSSKLMPGRSRRSSLPEHLLKCSGMPSSSPYASLRINVGGEGIDATTVAPFHSPVPERYTADNNQISKPNSPFFSPKLLPPGRSPGAIISATAKGLHHGSLWKRKERNSPKNRLSGAERQNSIGSPAGGSPAGETEALPLAPILAKRLADDKQVSSSGGSSSSGSSSQRRDSKESTDLPILLRRLEGRHGKIINLVGTSNLSQARSSSSNMFHMAW